MPYVSSETHFFDASFVSKSHYHVTRVHSFSLPHSIYYIVGIDHNSQLIPSLGNGHLDFH